jgi:hypothetical protein
VGRLRDQRAIDRHRIGELPAAEERETEQREHLAVLWLQLEREQELRLRVLDPALPEQLAPRDDVLIERVEFALEGWTVGHDAVVPLRVMAVAPLAVPPRLLSRVASALR